MWLFTFELSNIVSFCNSDHSVDMYSKTFVFLLCLCFVYARETSYFSILKEAQHKLSIAPKIPNVNREVSQIFTQVENALTRDFFENLLNEFENNGPKDNFNLCLSDLKNLFESVVKGERWGLEGESAFFCFFLLWLQARFYEMSCGSSMQEYP